MPALFPFQVPKDAWKVEDADEEVRPLGTLVVINPDIWQDLLAV